MLTSIFLFLLGTVLGSFLNVVIYRLPRGESILAPSSHCPRCGRKLTPWENIPLLSYLLLGGKCRTCKVWISPRYPVVEFLMGISLPIHHSLWGFSPLFFAYSVFFALLLLIIFIDLDHLRIPDPLTLGGILLGLLFALISGALSPLKSLFGVLLGASTLLFVRWLGTLIFKKEAMGLGDVKFLAMVGAFLGPLGALFTLFAGSLWGTLMVPILNKKHKERSVLPFGPYLSLGALTFLYFGGYITRGMGL
jgi:leader peptidase (prepilin peptidase)/N-methyltransferase